MQNDQTEMVTLEPCGKCRSTNVHHDQFNAVTRNRWVISCDDCDYMTATFETQEEAAAAWNRLAHRPQPAEPVAGWIVANGAGDQWRTWDQIGPRWTGDRDKATRYARREDAEAVHAEDLDAWLVEPYTHPAPAPAGELVERDREVAAIYRAMKGAWLAADYSETPEGHIAGENLAKAILAEALSQPDPEVGRLRALLKEALDALDYLPVPNTRSKQCADNLRQALGQTNGGERD